MVSLKIYSELNNLFIYGVALSSSTALAGAFVRPFSGKLVDKYDPVNIIILSLTAYMIVDTGLYISSGLPLIILMDTTNISIQRHHNHNSFIT